MDRLRRQPIQWLPFALLCLLLVSLACDGGSGRGSTPAFPGVEGYGAASLGGRGGTVYIVNSLEDYLEGEYARPGTLRYAVEHRDPHPNAPDPDARTIVFDLAGTIVLKRELVIDLPRLTIAGQTAPGEGILIRNQLNSPPLATPLQIHADDVVIRHVQVRPGILEGEVHGSLDGVKIGSNSVSVRHVVLDHLSVSWSSDEVITIVGDTRWVTIQNSIFSEGLDQAHPQILHSGGSLIGSGVSGWISLHRNLWAHNGHRNPRIITKGPVDFTNNVIYNWSGQPGVVKDENVAGFSSLDFNFVGNYYIPGLALGVPGEPSPIGAELELRPSNGSYGYYAFLSGNLSPTRRTYAIPEEAILFMKATFDPASLTLVGSPFGGAPSQVVSAPNALGLVVTGSGAQPQTRNAIDARIVVETLCGYVHYFVLDADPPPGLDCPMGWIIHNQDEVLPAGWPDPSAVRRPFGYDLDRDGMEDAWELVHGLDPLDAEDSWLDFDGDGYTNLEEFLNGTTPD